MTIGIINDHRMLINNGVVSDIIEERLKNVLITTSRRQATKKRRPAATMNRLQPQAASKQRG